MKKKESMEYKDKKWFLNGKCFNSFEEMMGYCKNWPDLPLELDFYENFFKDRLKEIKLTIESNKNFTNRMYFSFLRSATDWVNEETNSDL